MQNKLVKIVAIQNDTPPFVWKNPGKAICNDGRIIDTSGAIWALGATTQNNFINWNLLNASADIKDSIKAYIYYLVESQGIRSPKSAFDILKAIFIKMGKIDSLSDITFERCFKVLEFLRLENSDWRFGSFRRWYRWGYEREIPNFDKKISERLGQIKIPRNVTGLPVRTRDPDKGPFSDYELSLIRKSVKNDSIPLLQKVGVMLLLELGARPAQILGINEEDLHLNKTKDGNDYYSLDLIRLKQRVVGRFEKKRRRISNELGKNIKSLIEENYKKYASPKSERPLFYSGRYQRTKEFKNYEKELYGRMSQNSFLRCVKNFAKNAQIISTRTGKNINLYPYRFRYTFGIKLANQGTPVNILAELLDHTCMESVTVYTNSTNNQVTRLNSALGSNEYYLQVIENFLGSIIDRPPTDEISSTINGTTPTLKNLGGIGQCGANYFCNLYPPLSCYVCPKFQAWKDAPHEEMLLELKKQVQLLKQVGGNPTDRIPYQYDDVIVAIEALLTKIKED